MEKRDLKKSKKDFFNENEELETAKQSIWFGGISSEEETSKQSHRIDLPFPEKISILTGAVAGLIPLIMASSKVDTSEYRGWIGGTFKEKEEFEQKVIIQLIDLFKKERKKNIELENELSESKQERLEIEKLYKSRYEQMSKDYNEKIKENNLIIDGLKEQIKELRLTMEDLQLFLRTPKLTDEKMKSILAKYEVEEENEEI